jgi:hypothetical protein
LAPCCSVTELPALVPPAQANAPNTNRATKDMCIFLDLELAMT